MKPPRCRFCGRIMELQAKGEFVRTYWCCNQTRSKTADEYEFRPEVEGGLKPRQ